LTSPLTVRAPAAADHPAILALADRLPAFGPTTRAAQEIVIRERRALTEALAHPIAGCALRVADDERFGVVGVLLLETRRDYFTDEPHGHVAILAVAREAVTPHLG